MVLVDGEHEPLRLAFEQVAHEIGGVVLGADDGDYHPLVGLAEFPDLTAEIEKLIEGLRGRCVARDLLIQFPVVKNANGVHRHRDAEIVQQLLVVTERAREAVDEGLPPGKPFQRGAVIIGVRLADLAGERGKEPGGPLIVDADADLDHLGRGAPDQLGNHPIRVDPLGDRHLLDADIASARFPLRLVVVRQRLNRIAHAALKLPVGEADRGDIRIGLAPGPGDDPEECNGEAEHQQSDPNPVEDPFTHYGITSNSASRSRASFIL